MNHLSISNLEEVKQNILNSGECEIFLTCQEEDISPFGQFATGDEEDDRKMAQDIMDDYNNGNEWAWCCVKLQVRYHNFIGTDYLGCCSYKSEQDFKDDGYYQSMIGEALYVLISNMVEMVNKGQEAQDLLINHLNAGGI